MTAAGAGFDPFTRRHLSRLGLPPRSIDRLAQAASRHRAEQASKAGRRWWAIPGATVAADRRTTQRLLKACRALAREFERAGDDFRASLSGATSKHVGLDAWLEDLASWCHALDGFEQQLSLHGRGRPVNFARRRLEREVAAIWQAAGLRLTKTRDGRFAQALAIALDAGGEAVPEDLGPVVRRLAAQVKKSI